MQGGRKPGKWVEIQNQLEREEINVYALAETHLRDLEAPPVIDNYVWEGCNRTSGMKKGEELACLLSKEQTGREYMKAVRSTYGLKAR